MTDARTVAATPTPEATVSGVGGAAEPALRSRRRRESRSSRLALGLLIPVLFLACWQLSVSTGLAPKAVIPGPMRVLRAVSMWLGTTSSPQMFYSGKLLGDLGATVLRVVVGFIFATVVGVGLGTAIGVWRIADDLLTPSLRILGPIPPVTWVPVVIVVLGVGQPANLALAFLGAVFPIVSSTVTSVSGVNRELLRAGRMIGHGQLGLVLRVIVPASLPGIVGGLRIGLGLSWMMAVTSEMLAVKSGLGYTLWNSYNYFDYPGVFGAMLVIGVCGFASDLLLQLAMRRPTRWHAETGVRS